MILALAFPEPGKSGRKSSFASKLETLVPREWVSRLSEARKIAEYSLDLADQVRLGSCPFQRALDQATISALTYKDPASNGKFRTLAQKDPVPYGTPTKFMTGSDLQAAAARHQKTINEENRARLQARLAEIPVEKWLSNWRPEALADRVIAADRIEAGYAKKVIDAINEKMGAPSVMMH